MFKINQTYLLDLVDTAPETHAIPILIYRVVFFIHPLVKRVGV